MLNSEVEFLRAQHAAELGDYGQARQILMGLLRTDPNNRNGWLLMAEVVTKPEHAVKSLERVLALDPNNETARLRLAELTGQPAQVEENYLTSSSWKYQEKVPEPAPGSPAQAGQAAHTPAASPWKYVEANPDETAADEQPAPAAWETQAPSAPGSTARAEAAAASPWAYVDSGEPDPSDEDARALATWETPASLPPESAFQAAPATPSPWTYVEQGEQGATGADEPAPATWETPASLPPESAFQAAPAAPSPWTYVEHGEEEPRAEETAQAHTAGQHNPSSWSSPAFFPPPASFQPKAPPASPWVYMESSPAGEDDPDGEVSSASWDAMQSEEPASPADAQPAPTSEPDWMAPARPVEQPPAKKRGARWELALIGVLALTAACILGLVLVPKAAGLVLSSAPVMAAAPSDEVILAAIETNIVASNSEDFDLYMSTIHSQSPAYGQTAETLEAIFSQYDLDYEISGMELLESSSREARVAFVLETRKLRGPEFRNNRIQGEMILRPEDGAWKIYNQKIDSVEYLN